VSEITLEFENRLEDHLHADRHYYSHGALAKVDKVVAVLLVLAGVALVVMAGSRWWAYVPFPLAVAEWFDLFSIRPLQIRVAFKANPKFRERYTLRFSEEGIHFKTATIDSTLKWDHYNACLESDRIFLLIYGKRMYTVVPKSAFPDSARIEGFRELVKDKVARATPRVSPT
jgi:hypothetical protein